MRFLAMAIALAVIGGCGQKGPLYLPPKNGTVVTRPATSAPPPSGTSQQPGVSQQPGASPQTNTPQQQPDKKDDDTSSRPK